MRFDFFKGGKVEDEDEHKVEKEIIKQALEKVEINQRRVFVGVKKV